MFTIPVTSPLRCRRQVNDPAAPVGPGDIDRLGGGPFSLTIEFASSLFEVAVHPRLAYPRDLLSCLLVMRFLLRPGQVTPPAPAYLSSMKECSTHPARPGRAVRGLRRRRLRARTPRRARLEPGV